MSAIPCTIEQFNQAFCEFHREIGDKSHTQDEISNMHKGLVLHYLGIQDASEHQMERAAECLKIATSGALRRGWSLDPEPLMAESE